MEVNATNLTAPSTGATVSIENLYPAIVQCFVIILFGYIAGRWDVITPTQGKGIGTFVSKFCLPALLFKNMCILNFGDVNWIFLLCILIAKSVVFFLVMTLCLLIKRPRNYGIAGLFAIFATQSNDFALGFPLRKFWTFSYLNIISFSHTILQNWPFPLMHCNCEPFDKWSWIGNPYGKKSWDQLVLIGINQLNNNILIYLTKFTFI